MSTATDEALPLVDDPGSRPALIAGAPDFADVTEQVARIAETPGTVAPRAWWIAFGLASSATLLLGLSVGYLFWKGVGVWGVNAPVYWGFAIVNFVFWVGIGHAGTLISAILFLFRQGWRTSISRFAEAMTVFAVVCAALFPGLHLGRFWLAYYMVPYPNQMLMWPQFRSPLLWDLLAVGTYFTVSVLFWYTGMIPDLATLRDRARTKWRKIVYGLGALGWRGSHRQWHRYEVAYLLLAAMITPLVLSVHSIVSFTFSTSIVPGWHSTLFPPYFVAGAIFSGLAMVGTLLVPTRKLFRLQQLVTRRHLETINKLILATGLMVAYAYTVELFVAWYSGNLYEQFAHINRALGPYWWAYTVMVLCNVIVPQLFWFKALRRHLGVMMVVYLCVNVGMWFERFSIVVTLSRDHLPSAWGLYAPTVVEVLTFLGSIGLFFTLFLLFLRFLPVVAISEVKGVLPRARVTPPRGCCCSESSSSPE